MNRAVKWIEPLGYWLGVHLVDMAAALAEYAAVFARKAALLEVQWIPRIKRLEATANVLEERRTAAAAVWERYRAETNGRTPELLMPVMAFLTACLLWLGETYLISGIFDGIGVADPFEQKLVAGVVVLAAGVMLEVAYKLFRARESYVVAWLAALIFAVITLVCLGWWRSAELIHATTQGSGVLQSFLSNNSGLTAVVITCLTVILPFGATLALDYGLSQGRFGWGWRRARRNANVFLARHESALRALEAAGEKLKKAQEAISKQGEEWSAAFRQAYQEGLANGALRAPFWPVAIRIGVALALSLAGVMLAAYLFADNALALTIQTGIARLTIYTLTAIGLAGIYAVYQIKAWYRPNAQQLWDQRTVIWRERMVAAARTMPAQPLPSRNGSNTVRPIPFSPAEPRNGGFTANNSRPANDPFFDDEITQVSANAS